MLRHFLLAPTSMASLTPAEIAQLGGMIASLQHENETLVFHVNAGREMAAELLEELQAKTAEVEQLTATADAATAAAAAEKKAAAAAVAAATATAAAEKKKSDLREER